MSSTSAVSRSDRTQPQAARRSPRAWRWGIALLVVLALHWIAALWVEHNRTAFTPENTVHVPVQIALLEPERIEQNPAAARPSAEAPAAPARKAAPASPREHVLSVTRASPAHVTAASAPAAVAASEAASAAATSAAATSAAAAASNAAAKANSAGNGKAPAAQAAPGVKFSVPPSGELQYDTFYNGVRNQPGTIHWMSDGKTYEMIVSVPLPFVGTFSYSSHGRVDAFGLAPDQYIEKRGHRAEDVSIFNRETKQIAFTKTPATLPLSDGAQDRFSMVMQLASLVRGDPGAYQPGVTRQFFVVDNDSGEIWPIETIGDETVRTARGFISARHFMRLPRHDGDKRRIDVWLAPSLGWLPARLVQTEPNGTEIELLWRGPLDTPVNSANGGTAGSGSNTSNNGGAPSGNATQAVPSASPADNPTGGAVSGQVTIPGAQPATGTTGTGETPAEQHTASPAADSPTSGARAVPDNAPSSAPGGTVDPHSGAEKP
jgi:hypothetical protein